MGEFFSEAPLGSIIVVVIGAIITIFVSAPLRIRAERRKAQRKKTETETGAPSMIAEDDGTRMAIVVDFAGLALMAIGFAIWIFD